MISATIVTASIGMGATQNGVSPRALRIMDGLRICVDRSVNGD
jgi:hypothetical protein